MSALTTPRSLTCVLLLIEDAPHAYEIFQKKQDGAFKVLVGVRYPCSSKHMATTSHEPSTACPYVIGDDGLSRWRQTHADAWVGLLETHKRLTRTLNAELEAEHGVSLSAVEVLGRLAAAEGRLLRLSVLAEQAGLSVSRISRMVDALQDRGLVERRACPGDGRARNAWLTKAGLELLRAAQSTHFAGVQRAFFDQLEPAEISALATIFTRFAPGAAASCT